MPAKGIQSSRTVAGWTPDPRSQWAAACYQTLPDFASPYLRLRLKKLKIGDDAMGDLLNFSLDSKSKRFSVSHNFALEVIHINMRFLHIEAHRADQYRNR
jgi:hypothetical protein